MGMNSELCTGCSKWYHKRRSGLSNVNDEGGTTSVQVLWKKTENNDRRNGLLR